MPVFCVGARVREKEHENLIDSLVVNLIQNTKIKCHLSARCTVHGGGKGLKSVVEKHATFVCSRRADKNNVRFTEGAATHSKRKRKKEKKTSTQSKLNTRELELSWKQDKIIGGINGQRWRNHPLELGNGIAHRKEDLEVILNLTLGF